MARKKLLTFAWVPVFFLLLFPVSGSHPEDFSTEYVISLKSRQFSPPEGISPQLLASPGGGTERIHAIVQFWEIPSAEERAYLEGEGIRLLNYLPERAWFASLPVSRLAEWEALLTPSVRSIVAIRPEDRLSPHIREAGIAGWAFHPDGTADVTVTLFADADTRSLEGFGKQISKQGKSVTLRIEPSVLPLVARLDTVQWIEDVPPSTSVHNDGSRAVINADYVQNSYGLKGSGVTIAEWDSGWIDPAHPDFAGRLTIKDSGCSEPNCTVSFHATHVGGTAVGSGSLSSGMYRGIAPLATLLSYEWPNSLSELTSEMSSAAASGAKISQNSWGWCIDPNDPACGSCGLHGDYDTFSGEYDRLVANLSLVTVFASGNEENDGDCPPYPYWQLTGPGATAKNTVTVGSVGSNDKAHSGFSSRGPTDDGRIKPDLVAAGCQTNGDLGINSTLPGATYGVLCGTSMAAPAVSGASALLIQKFQAEFGSAPRPATIKAIFVQTAADLGNKGPDYTFGFGLIDAKAAVDLINSDSGSRKRIIEGQIEHGKVKKVLVYLNGSEDVRFTVAWDDVPGSPVAAKQLVNDVFLQVLGPGGYQYRPWKLDPVNPGNPAVTSPSAFDDLNTVEQVEITKGAPPGYYTAWIQGASIPEGPQSYSLILPVENSGKTECGILPTSGCVVTQDTTFFPATYNLSSSIEILSDGVTLNMNGATFNGGVPLFTLAIRLDDKTGVTIKNGTIQKFFLGVQLKNSNDSLILNNTLRDNFYSGIGIYSSSNGNAIVNNSMINTVLNGGFGVSLGISSSANTITGNVFRMNGTGIFLSYSPNNLIFNNFFNSTKNAFDDSTNLWNTTKDCTKTNIVGGPCIGGNFWSDYAGKERDQDGLGGTNLPHNASGGIQSGGDFHPLLMPFAAKKCIIGGPCP